MCFAQAGEGAAGGGALVVDDGLVEAVQRLEVGADGVQGLGSGEVVLAAPAAAMLEDGAVPLEGGRDGGRRAGPSCGASARGRRGWREP